MNFPSISKKQTCRLTIPKLDGGINGCDSEMQIEDNQLTDCLNMWWKDGALRTRPGLLPILTSQYSLGENAYVIDICGGSSELTQNGKVVRKALITYGVDSSPYSYNILLFTTDYNGNVTRSKVMTSSNIDLEEEGSTLLVENSGKQWGGTAENCALAFIYRSKTGCSNILFAEPSSPGSAWVDVSGEAYIPLVYRNGIPSKTLDSLSQSGSSYEDYNMLTAKFRVQFTSNNAGIYYTLPVKGLDNTEIQVTRVQTSGNVKSYTIAEGATKSAYDEGYANVDRTGGYLWFSDSNNVPLCLVETGIQNNVEITAAKTIADAFDTICAMRISAWFGGDHSGYNGGTRLFVSGNPRKPNLVRWSGVNNPLYFPQENYAYVGDAGQTITAFGKQGEKLVLFKEHELYFATYASGGSSTGEASAAFPITQLHPFIGCDCPGTIQLCDNRLIWANCAGKVYTLVNTNQYNESCVREVSRNIEKWLSTKTYIQMKAACSGDYRGHYVLLSGNELFLFDYTDTNYISYLLYSKYSKSQAKIPWLRWALDCGLSWDTLMANGDSMALSGTLQNGTKTYQMTAVLSGDEDHQLLFDGDILLSETAMISSSFRTKLFYFSAPENRKDVKQVYIHLQSDSSSTVSATYITECGETTAKISADETVGNMMRLKPNEVRILCFGLQVDSLGSMSVGDIVLKYQIYKGGIR